MTKEIEMQRSNDTGARLRQRMSQIKQKILVLSGKGGVGKSTIAANLAISLAAKGKRVGLLDVDIHGPSIPQILGLTTSQVRPPPRGTEGSVLVPVPAGPHLRVMSIGFLLESRETPVIWRGPMKYNMIRQFLADVAWGELDCLVVDSPPGTGDEPLAVVQLIDSATGAIVVTTPQDLAVSDVRKCVTFCRHLSLPVLGVVENMSGFVCPACGERTDIFKTDGGRRMAEEMGVPFLARIPIEPQLVDSGDAGAPYLDRFTDTQTAHAFATVVEAIRVSTMLGKASTKTNKGT
jgi:ATP-binding protein involved in chromosome partitioning